MSPTRFQSLIIKIGHSVSPVCPFIWRCCNRNEEFLPLTSKTQISSMNTKTKMTRLTFDYTTKERAVKFADQILRLTRRTVWVEVVPDTATEMRWFDLLPWKWRLRSKSAMIGNTWAINGRQDQRTLNLTCRSFKKIKQENYQTKTYKEICHMVPMLLFLSLFTRTAAYFLGKNI